MYSGCVRTHANDEMLHSLFPTFLYTSSPPSPSLTLSTFSLFPLPLLYKSLSFVLLNLCCSCPGRTQSQKMKRKESQLPRKMRTHKERSWCVEERKRANTVIPPHSLSLSCPLSLQEAESLNNKLCTFTVTQKEFRHQHWYHCHTCHLVDGSGVCSICAKVCHKVQV